MKAIVCSRKDAAGMNLFEKFCEKGFEPAGKTWEGNPVFGKGDLILVTVNDELLYSDNLSGLDVSEIIFPSRHSSAAKVPTFTVHPIGNFGKAELGGRDGELCQVNANTMRNIYGEILKNPFPDFQVSLEVTHHGPFIKQPGCFVELGSCEAQWKNEKAADFLADCILNGLESGKTAETAIGIGGPHYAPAFSKIEAAGNLALGHICARYAQDGLDKKKIEEMINKTLPTPKKVLVDENGIKSKTKLLQLAKDYEVELI